MPLRCLGVKDPTKNNFVVRCKMLMHEVACEACSIRLTC